MIPNVFFINKGQIFIGVWDSILGGNGGVAWAMGDGGGDDSEDHK